jgi:hypothetical protein
MSPRLFIGKHPCDDLPYIHDVDPDPRSGDSHFTHNGPDYSGWYVRQQVTEEMVERMKAGFDDPGVSMPEDWTSWDPLVSAFVAALGVPSLPGDTDA